MLTGDLAPPVGKNARGGDGEVAGRGIRGLRLGEMRRRRAGRRDICARRG